MKIKINKYGYITAFATIGDLDDSIDVDFDKRINHENYYNFQFVENSLKYNPIPYDEKPEGCKIEYTGDKWIETATQEECEGYKFIEDVKFYNKELEFASKANIELACGIITEDVFEEVKTYMKSIDPYAGTKTIPEVKRPEIFKKYL